MFNGRALDGVPYQLQTASLILRPFVESDENTLQRLMNDYELADNMINVPHPYTLEDARQFVRWARNPILNGGALALAIVPKDAKALIMSDTLVGGLYLEQEEEHRRAQLGYWCGRNYRGRGYITAAAQCLIQHSFMNLGLNRVYAYCFTNNLSSAAVLRKCQMRYEGTHRSDIRKADGRRDVDFYGVLRREWRPVSEA